LENRARRAVIMAERSPIAASDLELTRHTSPDRGGPLREQHERVERALVRDALERAGGNVSQAARQLGISRPALYDRLRRFGLERASR
jgi:two-component system NtrC family response regulator